MDMLKFCRNIEFPYAPQQLCWINAAIGAAVGIGSAIFGASKSAKAEKEARAKEQAAYNSNKAYFNRKMNESYGDTAAGQNMIRQAKDYANENWKKAQGAAAVGGGTDAATAMAKEAGNKMVGNTVAQMAANDTARKDAAGAQMANLETQHAHQEAGALRQQGANIANAASQMGNAIGGAISSMEAPKAAAGAPVISQTEKAALNADAKKNPDEWNETKKKILGM